MNRAILLLTTLALALMLAGGPALTQSGRAAARTEQSQTGIKRLKTRPKAPPANGMRAPRAGEGPTLAPGTDGQRAATAAATSAPSWRMGSFSNTHVVNPFFGVETFTMEWAGYWGSSDGSYPRVGELYGGRVQIGNSNPTFDASVAPEVLLPPNTHFAIDPGDPNPDRRVHCYLQDTNAGTMTELTGSNCDQTPSRGIWGARFVPSQGFWTLRAGQMLILTFPIFSTAVLNGIAAAPAACVIGAFEVAGAVENDAPEAGDSCPTANGDGPWQGVFVAFNPATIGYPSPSTTNITASGGHSTAHLSSHFNGGTAFFDLGTTTAYGQSVPVTIPADGDSWEVFVDWTGLKAGTAYHWRLRFVDGQGRSFTGADQTFTTAAPPADTTAPTKPILKLAEAPNTPNQIVRGTKLFYRPATGQSGSFTVTATAADPESGIKHVGFPAVFGSDAGTDAAGPYDKTYAWSAGATASGPKGVTATNTANLTSQAAPFAVVPDLAKPTVSITAPAANATVAGSVAVRATAGDGTGAGVTRVVFRRCQRTTCALIGTGVRQADGSYQVSWTTTGLANGTYKLQAYALDGVGNRSAFATVTVTVRN
ncbi:MAG: hypothetical protein AVDCRST_MAG73-2201 [uncultured Thermomicrobiales bacterium]|uniref:Bacterial Ig-like domain-containing protein n=1 Tax=uncultured Thermomicrobiales bacterium TaxID=1645740 RepID=A0A6J4U8R0_9BACT|nr:MAG: hypothetical protein AVDCRST_MAG73-2201 [uncultured Thermomicrobiales bacterium]